MIRPGRSLIVDDFCDLTRTYRTTTLADSETQTSVQSHSVDKLNSDLNVITRHYHFYALRQMNLTGAVHCTEVELRTILVSERSVTSTLFLLQNVDRSLELLERLNLSRMAEHHTTLDFILVDTTEKQTYVITSLTLIKELTEHLDTCNDRLLVLTKTEQLNLITYVDNTSLDTSCSNSTTTCDREYVLNRHQERFVGSTGRLLDPCIASVHQLHNLIFPLSNTVQSTKCRTADDRSIVAIELILIEQLTHFHLNELKHLLILNHITLVQEYDKTRNVHLTSEKHVLTCLRHRTVSSSNYDDSTIHLSSTSNHVLNVVGVTRAVYVSIVTLFCLILDVRSIDGDTTLFLLRSIINLIKRLNVLATESLLVKNLRDGSGQSCLTMVNVTDSSNVYVRFGAHKLLFSHSLLVYLF